MDKPATDSVRQNYNRIAFLYDIVDWFIPSQWRSAALSRARGRTLEAGVGSGLNLPLYPPAVTEVIGIDISRRMLDKAMERAPQCGAPVSLYTMDVQSLAFPDAYFDTVLATCVFCTVPDPLLGLSEMRRVCKPDGIILLVEHVRSRGWLGKLMDWLNPATVRLIGDHINRDTVQTARQAGIELLEVVDLSGDIVKLIIGRPSLSCQVSCVSGIRR